jgi:hypothetical protein
VATVQDLGHHIDRDSLDKIRTAADGDAVFHAIDQARSSGRISEKRVCEMLTFAVHKIASVLSAAPARDWLAVAAYIEGVIARFGANRELEQALKTYRGNIAVDFHNRFAVAWKKNFDESVIFSITINGYRYPSI